MECLLTPCEINRTEGKLALGLNLSLCEETPGEFRVISSAKGSELEFCFPLGPSVSTALSPQNATCPGWAFLGLPAYRKSHAVSAKMKGLWPSHPQGRSFSADYRHKSSVRRVLCLAGALCSSLEILSHCNFKLVLCGVDSAGARGMQVHRGVFEPFVCSGFSCLYTEHRRGRHTGFWLTVMG